VEKSIGDLPPSARYEASVIGAKALDALKVDGFEWKDVPEAELGTGSIGRAPMTVGWTPNYMSHVNRPGPERALPNEGRKIQHTQGVDRMPDAAKENARNIGAELRAAGMSFAETRAALHETLPEGPEAGRVPEQTVEWIPSEEIVLDWRDQAGFDAQHDRIREAQKERDMQTPGE
jgi:hypothetical protein